MSEREDEIAQDGSAPGSGSGSSDAPSRGAVEPGQSPARRHVLLVEDEENITEVIRFLLTREGWQVETHGDGATALNRIRERGPDLLILDLMLPGRSGLDILRDLRADPALAGLPVLMLTARGQDTDKVLARQAGADMFMTKPFSNSEVIAAVRDLAGTG